MFSHKLPQFGIFRTHEFQKNEQFCTWENYVLLLLFFEGRKDPRASCVYIHTALVSEDTALRLEMPLSCYYQKTQKRVLFVLLHDILYTTGGTQPPSETTINWASSGAKWRTQYYAPTISVQVVVFYNTKMSQISSPFF